MSIRWFTLVVAVLAFPPCVRADSTGEHAPTQATGGFTNASSAFACDGSTATATANNQAAVYSLYGLSLPNTVPTPVVTGIQVRVRANDGTKNNRKLKVSLSWDGGTTYTDIYGAGVGLLQTRNFRRGSPLRDQFLGGSATLWGRTAWSAGELGDANFRVKLAAKMPGPAGDNINLDCIPVTVFYEIPGLPSLNVAKTAGPDPVGPTGNLTYTIAYGNTGGSTATNTIVSDVTPANTTFVSANPAPTSAPAVGGTGTVSWNVGSLGVGGSGVVTLVVKVNAPIGTQIVNDTYGISSDQNPPTVGNPVSTTVANAVLTLDKTASPDPVAPGGTLTYTLTVHNQGAVAAANVVINEGYDANAPFASQSTSPAGCASFGGAPDNDQWSIASLAAGATCVITVTTDVASDVADGVVLLNLADVGDDAGDAASAGAFAVVNQCAAQTDGTPCDDGNACTQTDACQSGECTGANPVLCSALDQCHDVGTCNPASGLCSDPAKTDGSACTDGIFCNGADSCVAGACTVHPGNPCPGDHVGPGCDDSCNEAAGDCTAPDPAGTGCDDGAFCTAVDACDGAGACVGSGDPCPGPDGDDDCSESCNEAAHDCTAADLDGSACDDGLFCTVGDACLAGSCVTQPRDCSTSIDQCHSGACDEDIDQCVGPNKPDGTECTSGDACLTGESCTDGTCGGGTAVVCDACQICMSDGGCVFAPRTDCRSSTLTLKSKLLIKNRDPDTADLVVWKWIKGAETSLNDLGDPTSTTSYTLCLFDQTGLRRSLTAPAGGTCGATPCWKATGTSGFKYIDKDHASDGVLKVLLRAGTAGKAKALLKAKGDNVAPPTLPLENLPVTAQLQRSDGGACWETTHASAGILKDDDSQFKAKDD